MSHGKESVHNKDKDRCRWILRYTPLSLSFLLMLRSRIFYKKKLNKEKRRQSTLEENQGNEESHSLEEEIFMGVKEDWICSL